MLRKPAITDKCSLPASSCTCHFRDVRFQELLAEKKQLEAAAASVHGWMRDQLRSKVDKVVEAMNHIAEAQQLLEMHNAMTGELKRVDEDDKSSTEVWT
jgi:hypothetical protein